MNPNPHYDEILRDSKRKKKDLFKFGVQNAQEQRKLDKINKNHSTEGNQHFSCIICLLRNSNRAQKQIHLGYIKADPPTYYIVLNLQSYKYME